MSFKDFINQDIVTTLVSLIGASFVAAYISEKWQRRSKMYDLKLKQANDIIAVYHKYLRLVKGDINELKGKSFDEIHSTMVSLNKINQCLFKSGKIYSDWDHVYQNFASIRNERLHNKEIDWDEKISPIREKADEAMHLMFKELI